MNRLAPLLATVLALGTFAAAPKSTIQKDVTYATGGDTQLQLDIATPPTGEGPFPAIIFIHGGGWTGGTRQGHEGNIGRAALAGYVAATITYRLAPTVHFPAQVEDCKAAVRWLRANAKQYKVDPDHIGLLGDSAGGHLVSFLGTTSGSGKFEGTGGNPNASSDVQAVVDFYGPSDFTRTGYSEDVTQKCVIPFLGGTIAQLPDVYRDASPATYVSPKTPPFLILHGSSDNIVPLDQSESFYAKLKDNHVEAELHIYPGNGHGFTAAAREDAWKRAIVFFDEHLKPKK